MRKFLYLLLAACFMSVLSSTSMAADGELENRLIKALKIKKNGLDRQARSRPVILAYQQAGILKRSRNRRIDYMDFYIVDKPASFMGQKLVLLEEEYMDTWVGCCVSPGMGLAVQVSSNTDAMEKFALENACTLTPHFDLKARFKDYLIKHQLPVADYAYLSCRERDLPEDE
ncbi:hypothetical protein ACO0LC_20680 [Undibacterium sp. JH2W]|uniref:hypothetical protein n=1 Tax=Undibacterium sp. JH2W TaxID=3413037 RepID=UPI003BF3DCFE